MQEAQQEVAGAFWINMESGVLHGEEVVLRLACCCAGTMRVAGALRHQRRADGCGAVLTPFNL